MSTSNNSTNYTKGGSIFGSAPVANADTNKEKNMAYKARKYHYKIQHVLKERIANGGSIPPGYEQYLKEFQA